MKGLYDLSERDSSVLRSIVKEYINSGKPVGSRSFVQKYSFALSPATMRNIMYDLEKQSFLTQTHLSSGRVPTDVGYRFYVDSLMEEYQFDSHDDVRIDEDILRGEVQFDKIFYSIAKKLSEFSSYAGVMLEPQPKYTVVRKIELVQLGLNEVLMVLVTRTGMIITKKVILSNPVTQDELQVYSRYLSGELSGYTMKEISQHKFDELRGDRFDGEGREIALDIAELAFKSSNDAQLYLEGVENLFKIPEMVESDGLDSVLNMIEDREILRDVLENAMNSDTVVTKVGSEIASNRLKKCSMVMTSYKIGSVKVGTLGVVGPTRLDYEKVIPFVDYTGKIVSSFLTKMSNR